MRYKYLMENCVVDCAGSECLPVKVRYETFGRFDIFFELSRDIVSIFRDPRPSPPGSAYFRFRHVQRRHVKLEPTTNYEQWKIDILIF